MEQRPAADYELMLNYLSSLAYQQQRAAPV
jgi:hypothetical protein